MDSDRERTVLSFAAGLALGAAIGAGVALLTTPESGTKRRKRLRRGARRISKTSSSRLDDLASELKGKIDDAVSAASRG